MTIDWQTETPLSLNEAAKRCPGGPSLSSIWRWCTKGTAGGIRLESFVRAGRRFTSLEALARFIERTTAATDGMPSPAEVSLTRRKSIDAAEQFCRSQGI